MKHGIHLLLAFTLAGVPFGCNRDNSNDQVVSASPENPGQVNTPPEQRQLNPDVREAPRTPAPAPKPRASVDRTNNTNRTDRDAELDRAEESRNATENREPAPPPVQTVNTATLPAGTAITVAMIDSVSTDGSAEGDSFTASLVDPITFDGKVLAERGAKVTGRVQNIEQPGKVKGKARLELVLTKLTTGGKTYNLNTDPFIAIAEDNKDRDAGIIAGGAGVGAVIGGIAGGKKGAAIGAILGGGGGTTAVLVTKGQDMRIDSETRVRFVTQDEVRLPIIRTTVS